jgi:hypothetical protein
MRLAMIEESEKFMRKRIEGIPMTLKAVFCRHCYSLQRVKTVSNELTMPKIWMSCGHSRPNDVNGESR